MSRTPMIRRRVPVMLPDGVTIMQERSVPDYFDAEPEPEDKLAIEVYGQALAQLAKEDRRYLSNFNIWQRWDAEQRIRWINTIERQAQAGAQTIGVDVVTRAAVIRLGE